MKLIAVTCLILAVATCQSWAQIATELNVDGLPSSMPNSCDPNTCQGCTPFLPPPAIPDDVICGGYDGYFPIPVQITKNDLSSTQDLVPKQWVCLPCCMYGCGFNDSGSKCAEDAYSYKQNITDNEFGCVKCASSRTKNPNAGYVKTSFQTLSTTNVYSVINQQFSSTFLSCHL